MTHAPLYDHEIDDAGTALAALLGRVESQVCDPSAYGRRIEDPGHPWHGAVMAARDALWKAGRDRERKRAFLDAPVGWGIGGMALGGLLALMATGWGG